MKPIRIAGVGRGSARSHHLPERYHRIATRPPVATRSRIAESIEDLCEGAAGPEFVTAAAELIRQANDFFDRPA